MARSETRTGRREPVLVDLAPQGGGAHGAFTWGVLNRLLEESWLIGNWTLDNSWGFLAMDLLARLISPYDLPSFGGNPILVPLVTEVVSDDTTLVPINPIERPGTPRDIRDGMNEISFKSVAPKEPKMLALLRRVADAGSGACAGWARMRMHMVRSHVMVGLGYSLKLNAEWAFLSMLRDKERKAAQAFLDAHADNIGKRSSVGFDALLEGV